MSEKDKLDILLYNAYKDLSVDIKNIYKLELIANRYKVSFAFLHSRYEWLINMGIDPNFCHLDENHKLIFEIFDECNKMLNDNNIEYYYTSGILAYLLVNKKLERYHHDLDIFINMNHLEKLENICNNYNFSFTRKIGIREDGTKRVMIKMYYQTSVEIPITIFMYTKEKGGSIIQKDYFYDNCNEKYVEYIHNSPLISKLSFSESPKFHNNIKYYSITPEALFLCKDGNREKDIYDCNIFCDIVDKEKLEKLAEAFKNNIPNKIVAAKYDFFSKYIFENRAIKRVLMKQ